MDIMINTTCTFSQEEDKLYLDSHEFLEFKLLVKIPTENVSQKAINEQAKLIKKKQSTANFGNCKLCV